MATEFTNRGGLLNPSAASGYGRDVLSTPAGQAQVERMPLVHDAIAAAEARLQDLNDFISRLEQRLCVVMRPAPPSNTPAVKDQEHPVAFVAIINRLQNRVEYENGRLSGILDRLEI